ncbi:DEAD/DEAH box helicase [Paenibacillus thermoaerophilus]|uniref:RNA helicase n=1 Tax=Paenibacillus thermoaerophilus TaxID=1215385 RepID=A0ABW2V038_9BACL|nr:DEAD/DEAH box helicase [Paenibacillus thermoaerophilus]
MNKQVAVLNLPGWLADKWAERGYESPTPVQSEVVPALAGGEDVVARSGTGTGKTLAFLLPVLQGIDADSQAVQAVVLAPTRELAAQLQQEAEYWTAGTALRTQMLIGGASLERQVDKLKEKPHLIVGTPGRVAELIKLRKLSLHQAKWIIADETDQLLELGDDRDLETVLKAAPRDRRIGFFSATVTEPVLELARRWMPEPRFVSISPDERVPRAITHVYLTAEARDKKNVLANLIKSLKPKAAIVFVNETGPIRDLLGRLRGEGIAADTLFGQQSKQGRAAVMQQFRKGKIKVLISTDVAARGLDIPNLTHVFQFDPAPSADAYVHRSGRTGRMGAPGTVISLAAKNEEFIVKKFEKQLRVPIERKVLIGGKLVTPLSPEEAAKLKEREAARRKREPSSAPIRTASVRTAAAPAGRKPAQGKPSSAAPAAPAKKKKAAKKQDKNKGAPRWLKAKWEQGASPEGQA